MTNIGQELSEIVAKVSYRDLPQAVVYKTKQVILDTIGCALAGRITDRARIALELVAELGGNPQAVIIGGGHTSWPLAAYVNAEQIHSLDFEPLPHNVPYVISPSLAIAERTKASGKEFLTAIALALEVGDRFQQSLQLRVAKEAAPYYQDNPLFSFGSLQVFGAVAGASTLLRLNSRRIANAFGIAGTSMPVLAYRSWIDIPRPAVMTKFNTLTGWIAELSTKACLLAEKGFTGDTTFLDSEGGLRNILAPNRLKSEIIISDLGKKWHIEQMRIKRYPCCGAHHAGIDLINQIFEQNDIDPTNIEEIVVKGYPTLLRAPWTQTFADVVTYADCQFCNGYVFAVAAYHGRKPSPYWQMPSTYSDPNILNLMKRVRTEIYPGGHELMAELVKADLPPSFSDTIVEITANGRKYMAERKSHTRSAAEQASDNEKPLTDDEIRAKFRNNASYSSLRRDKIEGIIDAAYRLDEIEDVSEMLRMLG